MLSHFRQMNMRNPPEKLKLQYRQTAWGQNLDLAFEEHILGSGRKRRGVVENFQQRACDVIGSDAVDRDVTAFYAQVDEHQFASSATVFVPAAFGRQR